MKFLLLYFVLFFTFVSCSKDSAPAPVVVPDDVITMQVTVANISGYPMKAVVVIAGASAEPGKVLQADSTLRVEEHYTTDVSKTIVVGTFPHYRQGDKLHDFQAIIRFVGSSTFLPLARPTICAMQWFVNGKPAVLPAAYAGYPTQAVINATNTADRVQAVTFWMNYL